jgi:hypothetical protein
MQTKGRFFLRRGAAFGLGALLLSPAIAQADTEAEISELRTRLQALEPLKTRLKRLENELAVRKEREKAAYDEGKRAGEQGARGARADAPAYGVPSWPKDFSFGGVQVLPGGFVGLDTLYRSRFIGADLQTPYWNIPYGNNVLGHASEFRLTERASRPSLLIKADVNATTHLAAFGEFDFLGAAQTATTTESNSFTPRVRQLYAALDLDEWGLHILGGQDWSLATLNSVGVRRDTHIVNSSIEAQPMPGVIWTRTPQLRIGKELAKEFSAALSIESPSSNVYGSGVDGAGVVAPIPGASAVGGFSIPGGLSQVPLGGSLYNNQNAITLNRLPDVVGKAAWDSVLADRKIHVEASGLMRDLTDRAWWGNHSVWTGAVGAGVVLELVPKFLDAQFAGMTGRGVGRYGTSQLFDASYSASGALAPIQERTLYGGLTLHATPQTDLYAFAGGEFASRTSSYMQYGKTLFSYGYGNPLYSNVGCDVELSSSATATGYLTPVTAGPALNCSGNIKAVRQISTGIWHNLYEGDFGKLRIGAQYTHTVKSGFDGIGGAPRGDENMVFTSFRYYPFGR